MNRIFAAAIAAVFATGVTGCVSAKRPASSPTPAPPGASLWEAPSNLTDRDLFHGPWGPEHAPNPNAIYTLVERKHTGVNLGLTVRDAQGREWSVKQAYPGNVDPEGPVEVVVSRLLSGIGYHQPPVFFLPAFTLRDDWGTHTEAGGRFRLKLDELKDVGTWKWEENPFVGSRPYQGLLVMMMMFNATDLKNSNNTLYEYRKGERLDRWYVARDIGAALGDTHRFSPRKGHIDTFEAQPFLVGVTGPHVHFAYNGWYQKFVRDRITPDDVVWASNLLGQLSDRQWNDAFRAAGFDADTAGRFIAKLRQKIAQGRSLRAVAD